MEHIIKKHWSILTQDPHLSSSLPTAPKFTYRRAPNVKAKIAPSKIQSNNKLTTSRQLTLIPLVGMYHCKKALCLTCAHVTHGKKTFVANGNNFTLKSFFNCSTTYVIYCISCPCGLLYVGRTIRTLRARFGEHRQAVQANNPLYSTARHFTIHHQQNISDLNVWIIESISDRFTPAERFQRLCRQVTFWIYTLNSMTPNGLNEEIEINTVI